LSAFKIAQVCSRGAVLLRVETGRSRKRSRKRKRKRSRKRRDSFEKLKAGLLGRVVRDGFDGCGSGGTR